MVTMGAKLISNAVADVVVVVVVVVVVAAAASGLYFS